MSENRYKSYNRIHKYSNPSDVEKEKIAKETQNFKKLNKKGKNLSKQITRNYSSIDDDMLDEYDASLKEAEQQKRTAKGHKKRLNTLKKRDDFY